ncbi:uncharacterized protein MELLADRAFT_59946 [Melampsora larici-populina 98AG31]|uniref:Uncharacterized protein n=1 Tax=Melampsora larici-populina (strain 98AG31 / pathotype 3-4-7) TaxID=747676 RepID=F4R9D6_MELLP|nr:uncharacterized protein MELLADRAFT_59946 [Melampsora larici-populina 98AG31]EGG10968.1 hypothetical protein MELLADRAFT_59946 [Melampsora larici-populina 98AG31]
MQDLSIQLTVGSTVSLPPLLPESFWSKCTSNQQISKHLTPPTEGDPSVSQTSPSRPGDTKLPKSGPYGDLPTVFTYPHGIDWKKNQTEVYDNDGNVVFLLSNKVNGTSIGKEFVINSPQGDELLRVAMHVVRCLVPQTYSATHGITYQYDTRAALPDKIHIHSDTKMKDGLKHDEYIYHRRIRSDTGSIKIGNSSKDRVAKIFQDKTADGWQREKIGHKKEITVIRSNNEIPGPILVGTAIISSKVIHKCGY